MTNNITRVSWQDEVREYAKWLGMELEDDRDLFWIAKEGLKAPLPDNWKPCKTVDTDEIYYFNFATGGLLKVMLALLKRNRHFFSCRACGTRHMNCVLCRVIRERYILLAPSSAAFCKDPRLSLSRGSQQAHVGCRQVCAKR